MAKLKKILCVEDNPDSCELLQFVLSNEGFEVISCSDPMKAIELAEQDKFSAIILDYWLPFVSGVEICRKIRTCDKQTPIVFYSGAGFSDEIEKGLEAGANAYLVKPNDFEKLAQTVTKLVLESSVYI